MQLAALLEQPSYPFRVVLAAESDLRAKYLELDGVEAHPDWSRVQVFDVLSRSAILLELVFVGACLIEVLEEGASGGPRLDPKEIIRLVRDACHLDINSVVRDAQSLLQLSPPTGHVPDITLQAVIRSVRSTLESCPIGWLEATASSSGAEQLGHRCRTAVEGLQAFLLRSDPHHLQEFQLLGRAYAAGVVNARELAPVLRLSVPDCVVELERHGYSRSLEALSLAEERRSQHYTSVRQERLARASAAPSLKREDIERDVVATERIEGVDVRRWKP